MLEKKINNESAYFICLKKRKMFVKNKRNEKKAVKKKKKKKKNGIVYNIWLRLHHMGAGDLPNWNTREKITARFTDRKKTENSLSLLAVCIPIVT